MSGQAGQQGPSRNSRREPPALFGVPLPLVIISIVLAAFVGLMLSWALSYASNTQPATTSAVEAEGDNPTQAGGASVVTEQTVGREVRRLVDTASAPTPADFDVATCLSEVGAEDRVIRLDQVQWGVDEQPAWIIVGSQIPEDELGAAGGAVTVLVVTDRCGSGPEATRESVLWSGQTVVGGP